MALKGQLRVWRNFAIIGVLLALLPLPFTSAPNILQWLVVGLLLGGYAMAFDFSAGYVGVINLGFAAFAGLGAYTAGLLAVDYGLSLWLGLIAGMLAGAALGAFTGFLTLRFRGLYAAVVTLFFGSALQGIVTIAQPITGGSIGLTVPTFFGGGYLPYYYVILGLVIMVFIAMRLLVDSRFGLGFKALGDNLDAARASGIAPQSRILNFTVSCAAAGLFGAFYGGFYGVLTPFLLDSIQTTPIVVLTFMIGRGTLIGPALFAIPFTFLTNWLNVSFNDLPGLGLLIYGAGLIGVIIFYPAGLTGLYFTVVRKWVKPRLRAMSQTQGRASGGVIQPVEGEDAGRA